VTVFVIRDILARQTCDVISTFTSCMFNYLNNRFHCSPNNSLLSFKNPLHCKIVKLTFFEIKELLKYNCVTVFVIRDTLAWQTCDVISSSTSCLLSYFDFPSVSPTPDWLKFVAVILNFNTAPDWLKFVAAILNFDSAEISSRHLGFGKQ